MKYRKCIAIDLLQYKARRSTPIISHFFDNSPIFLDMSIIFIVYIVYRSFTILCMQLYCTSIAFIFDFCFKINKYYTFYSKSIENFMNSSHFNVSFFIKHATFGDYCIQSTFLKLTVILGMLTFHKYFHKCVQVGKVISLHLTVQVTFIIINFISINVFPIFNIYFHQVDVVEDLETN